MNKTAEISVYGNMSDKNSVNFICDKENKYKFCGFPIGVNILPRFAAMLINTTVRQIFESIPAAFKSKIPKGTKVIKATSFVINILLIKQRKTKEKTSPFAECIFFKRISAT